MKKAVILYALLCVLAASCTSTPDVILETEDLIIKKVGEGSYIHTTYLNTETWGKVPCNGLIYINDGQALIIDSPTETKASEMLLDWIEREMKAKTIGVLATHYHVDCVGGLDAFHNRNIPSYGSDSTIQFATQNGFNVPQNSFQSPFTMKVGNQQVLTSYFGRGHTHDNVVSFIAHDNVLFGGCLIKRVGAGKGNLEDADTLSWSNTVEKIKATYPTVKVVVPGHGKEGSTDLLDYTIKLFDQE